MTLAVVALPGAAAACDVDPLAGTDRPIQIGGDCSFQFAADPDGSQIFEGRPAVNLGGGRVAQRVTTGDACSETERLVMVDCATGEATALLGAYEDTGVGSFNNRTRLIQPPHGPVGLTANTTVSDAIAMARSGDVEVVPEFLNTIARLNARNRFNPFCGCALFYPNLPGSS